MGKVFASQPQLHRGPSRDRRAENSALPDRRFSKIITVAWLALGIASVALALIAVLVLRAERESAAVLHHLNLVALDLQDVLSDLADAEAEERGYLLTGRPTSLENFQRSRQALGLEFQRLTELVKKNSVQRQEVERVRYLVQQDLDELQRSITSHMAAGSEAAFAKTLTDRAKKLTEALRQSITGINEEDEGVLARLVRERRIRLAGALAAVSGALLLAASYVSVGQIIITRSESLRQETEAALRESENRFKTLCDQAPLGIYNTDSEGFCVYTNSRWCQMSGLSAAESLGHGWAKALHPADREAVFEDWKTYARQGRPWEYRLLTPEGKIRWIRALGGPIYSAGDEITGYIGTAEDITEHKHADQALQESEALNRAVLNSLPANIAVLDINGTIQAINEEWQRFAEANGHPPACSVGIGANYLEVCRRAAGDGSNDAETALGGIQDVLAGKLQSFSMQYPCDSATETRWFHMLVTPLAGVVTNGGVVIAHADITERKRAQDAVREALQERFRLSFEEAPVGMALIRGDGVWLRVNRALCEMTGYSESELIFVGRDITHPDDRAEESRLLARILSGALSAGQLEERYLHKQGHTIYVLLSIAVVERDEAGRPIHFVAHMQDLTERKRVEEELEASRAQMVSSSRLSALGMMAGSIAHEINNPMAVIHASAANISRMAESGSVQVPAVLKNSHRISQTADRISKIVRSLRHVSRESRADEFRETPVREIVDETLELCAERFRAHNIRIAVSAVDPEMVISCREAQICQVLLNLLQNAFDELVDLEGDRWVKLDVTCCTGWAVFSVSDSGPGIAAENIDHIMEPFFTTKPVGKGIGLGLSISRSIALEHGGTLELDAQSPHTCFRLKLPLPQRA